MLNDIPIMMIAYDNAKILQRPVRWDMRKVLSIATVLGITGVFASFLLLWLGEEALHLEGPTIQTLIFLKLAVAGHMTIYTARTSEQHFWIRPLLAYSLFLTAEITQVVATILAVYGIFMQPIGWSLAGLVWGYSFSFFLFNDFVKVKMYKTLNYSSRRHKRRFVSFCPIERLK